ncbi:Sec-independent protein translocase protein TatB [Lutibaculum baratangense]|uniref:Sec-independent protein translocase protein TatB n=1 Tax=Lutibaculum baratangense AMV1 TaxID=631454 RepID=V4RBL6_9HYPH|nr:Sec-independent protein translocase protein TatB [Lutibaculum baratangense]ESR23546.1 Twin-arginine translocation protein TatB [Lutibaculum baratangense AMV1]
MFDIGWSEMLVIGAVAILVVGPRELPGMLRTFGKYMGQIRRMAGEFQSQFNDALKEAELDEVRRGIESVRQASPAKQLRKELGSLKDAGDSVRKAVEDPAAPKAPQTGSAPASEQGPAKAEAPKAAPPVKGAVEDAPVQPVQPVRHEKTTTPETAS